MIRVKKEPKPWRICTACGNKASLNLRFKVEETQANTIFLCFKCLEEINTQASKIKAAQPDSTKEDLEDTILDFISENPLIKEKLIIQDIEVRTHNNFTLHLTNEDCSQGYQVIVKTEVSQWKRKAAQPDSTKPHERTTTKED